MGAVLGAGLGAMSGGMKITATPKYEFHEAAKNKKCQCGDLGCAMTFKDWKPDWLCHMCNINHSELKWAYAETAMGSGFKLVCSDCASVFRHAYASPYSKP